MTTREQMRKNPPSTIQWGYFNLGRFIGVARLKKEAIKDAEKWTGKPWAEISGYIEVHKVSIFKI